MKLSKKVLLSGVLGVTMLAPAVFAEVNVNTSAGMTAGAPTTTDVKDLGGDNKAKMEALRAETKAKMDAIRSDDRESSHLCDAASVISDRSISVYGYYYSRHRKHGQCLWMQAGYLRKH